MRFNPLFLLVPPALFAGRLENSEGVKARRSARGQSVCVCVCGRRGIDGCDAHTIGDLMCALPAVKGEKLRASGCDRKSSVHSPRDLVVFNEFGEPRTATGRERGTQRDGEC